MTRQSLSHRIKKIEPYLQEAMSADRYAAIRVLGAIRRRNPGLGPDPKALAIMENLEARLRASIALRKRRNANRPQPLYDDNLPIHERKNDIIAAISRHPVIIVSGETGSGKTTQLPKFCLDAGRGIDGLIGCTQPRRIAAVTVAHRISEELGEPLGRSVGYQIRFQDRTSRNHGYIKLMTDGILLAETQRDRYLNTYDTLIIDEAHERSLNIDFLLGFLRTLVKKRSDFKLIITSATIDTEKFSKAFDNAPVMEVSGRQYPVEVRYWKKPLTEEGEGPEEERTLADQAADAVDAVMLQGGRGDILVFMPTEHDIRETVETLEGRKYRHAIVLPLYARLSAGDQMKVFAPHPGRKIVVATNVAETSITVPGIRYVVDTGLARISGYDPRTRTTILPVAPISKSSADQRAGRCGRVEAGVCIRLFSEEDYENRPLFTPPEILRADLSEVILRMISLNLGDLAAFPFVDPPPLRQVRDGLDTLLELGAIVPDPNRKQGGPSHRLTPRGRRMAAIPLSPRLSRILMEAGGRGCLFTVAVIVAALTVSDPREKPRDAFTKAEAAHARFVDPASDFITLRNIWAACFGDPEAGKPTVRAGDLKKFCKAHFMSFKRMREWLDVHEQLLDILSETGVEGEPPVPMPRETREDFSQGYAAVHQSMTSGFLCNIAVKKEKNLYQAAGGRQAMIFPGSGLFNKGPGWIVAAEMIETSRLFARQAAAISAGWLEPLGGGLCKSSFSNPRWMRTREAVVADEQVSLFGLVIVSGRIALYGPRDPDRANDIFIRSALLDQDVRRPLPFMTHNRELVEKVRDMENRVRRRDLLVSDDALAAFYKSRLPGIYDLASLKKRIREKGGEEFLRMGLSDVLSGSPDEERLALFPDTLALGDAHFPCDYRFEPGQSADGITVRVPAAEAHAIPLEAADWVAPGLLAEKITELVKNLPKSLRRRLVPVSATVSAIMRDMPKYKGSLTGSLSRFIRERFGVEVPADAWNATGLPDHLRLRITLTDSRGRELVSSRDKNVLRQSVTDSRGDRAALAAEQKRFERTGLLSWEFCDVPEILTITDTSGREILVYPALVDEGESAGLKLFTSRAEAQARHPKGVGRLFRLYFAREYKFLEKSLQLPRDLAGGAWSFGGEKGIRRQLLNRVTRDLFEKNIRTRKDFQEHARLSVNRVWLAGRELLALVLPVLEAFRDANAAMDGIRAEQRKHPVTAAFVSELEASLAGLLPEMFIETLDMSALRHLPRYLKALAIRAERGYLDLEKDRKRAALVRPFAEWWRRQMNGSGSASSDVKTALGEFFWAIEEFKVSLFAQALKTAYPVSEKKLLARIREIERMAET